MLDKVKNIGQNNIAVSDVTCTELLYGARDKTELISIKKDLDSLIVIHIYSNISRLSIQLIKNIHFHIKYHYLML